ncbi:DNA-binding protein [Rhodanobacter umsongensis]|uniref:DNA-binding protein n=1 Tax=Rhodanobacter umsongensis TaxID=633153 RepID=A0ABW0JM27_9GAMM
MTVLHLTPDDLSARWQGTIKVQTLTGWRNKRKGPPFVKFGSRVLYPLDRLEEWEKKHTVETRD